MLRITSITTPQASRHVARRILTAIRNSSTKETESTIKQRRIGPKITKRKPAQSKKNFKREAAEETPWPRNWQIAGYTAFAISIPLSFLSAVVEQPYLRSMLTRDRPQDDTWGNALVNFLRTYWVEDGLFEGETAYQIAKDLALNRLMDYDVPVRILAGTSTSTSFGDEVEVRSLPSTIPAAGDFVWKAFYGGDHAMEGARVFVEFMDVANDKNEGDISEQRNEGLISGSSGSTDIVFSDEISAFNKQASTVDDEDQKLLHLMQGFSLWHYWPSAADESLSPSDQKSGGQTSETGGGKMSTEQIRISELEWQEAQLQMQMIDPNCTREIDAMESELADVRRELRSLKGGWTSWFRRK